MAKDTHRGLLGFVVANPQDEYRLLGFLRSLPGIRLRIRWEIWIAAQDDPDLSKQIKLSGAKISPNLLIYKDPGDAPTAIQVQLADILEQVAQGSDIRKPTLGQVKTAFPQLKEPERLLEFGIARAKDMRVAASEPFRTWLIAAWRIPELRSWAAARLVEANALTFQGEPDVKRDFLSHVLFRLYLNLHGDLQGNFVEPDNALLGWNALGDVNDIQDGCPFLMEFRKKMVDPQSGAITPVGCALVSPHLQVGDRDWVLKVFSRTHLPISGKHLLPEDSPAFWVASDWLLLYGMPNDWIEFRNSAQDPGLGGRLYQLEQTLKKIPGFWLSDPSEFTPKGDGTLLTDVWTNPQICLKRWSVPDAAFHGLGVQRAFMEREPLLITSYTKDGLDHHYEGRIVVRVKVDPSGKPIAVRPLPGFGLFRFAEDILKESRRCSYRAGTVGGNPVTDICDFGITYRIK